MGCVGIFSYDGAEVRNCGKHTGMHVHVILIQGSSCTSEYI